MDEFYADLYKFLHAIRPVQDANFPEIPTVELHGVEANNRGPVYVREFEASEVVIAFEAACDSIRCSLKFKRPDAVRDLFLKKLARSSQVHFLRRMPLPGDNATLLFIPSDAPADVFRDVKHFFASTVDTTAVVDSLKHMIVSRE